MNISLARIGIRIIIIIIYLACLLVSYTVVPIVITQRVRWDAAENSDGSELRLYQQFFYFVCHGTSRHALLH
jgi:heme/copper-type cytochrome/quinol oxidase subunit 1